MNILGLVENMSGYTYPHCGKSVDIFGSGGGGRRAAIPGLNLFGRIPSDPELGMCRDGGISYQHHHSDAALIWVFGGYRCTDIQRGPRSKDCK